jgi:glycosyltransferase involved in cell wall biosynthesis
MLRVMTFVRSIAGLLEPSLESEFYEEFTELSKYLELTVVSDMADSMAHNFKVHKVQTIRVPKIYGISKIISYIYAVFKHRKEIDILYVRTFSPPEIIALIFSKKLLRRKSVLLIPGTWIFEPSTFKNRIFKWIFLKAVNATDMLILYTPLMLPELCKHFPSFNNFKEKITYIHNGVNIERFNVGVPDINILSKYSIPLNRKIILFVGRVSFRKGVIDLVKAFSIVKKNINEVMLLIVGREDVKYGERVKRVIQELNIADSTLLLGPIPNKEVVEILKKCDLFVYPSIGGEGIPRAIIEAMACGKPVVATNIAGIPEVVKNGETGFLVKVGDYQSLAQYIMNILRNEKLARMLGNNARKLVEREFSYKVVIPELVKAFKTVIR